MAQNKVQYQRGVSLMEFIEDFGTVEKCEARVRAWRWADGFTCPKCGGKAHSEFRRASRMYFQCSACRYQCSLLAGTIFESSKIGLVRWFTAMHLISQAKNNVSALELMRHLRVTYPTAWMLKHKIMQVMAQHEEHRTLTGRVEIDDAYLGGEIHGAKAGRGSPNKVPFVAAVETTESGQAKFICLSPRPFTSDSIRDFARSSLAAPATLTSDGLGCFKVVAGMGILHDPHITGGGAASAKHPSFVAINTVLGNIKTSISGTYHAFGFRKYAARYLGQVQYLFNHRFDLRAILTKLGRAACATAACPLHAVRAAETSC